LLKQRGRIGNRIKSLLVAQGISGISPRDDFAARLETVRLWHGDGLSPELKMELRRLQAQYALFDKQLRELAAAYVAELSTDSPVAEKR
jgi:transposase